MKALVNLHGMKYAMLSSKSLIADTWSLTLYSAEAVLDSSLPRIVVIGEQSAGKRYVFNSLRYDECLLLFRSNHVHYSQL